ncbi:ABC transporter ATP-binding protein [Lachnoclostridium phytofermentans]|uniref:ABC transporter ATP-binding protein n=1 Tax=Lachnoclostridium phytofermentans TaxID=66219 RepID=UPI000496EDFC|nr:ABC transporter ATP-binding protein [Lachnoclostridium phytofermentans]
MQKVKNDKILVKQLFSNVRYSISFAWKADKAVVLIVYLAFFSCFIIDAFYSTLFLKLFIQMLSENKFLLGQTIVYVIIGIGIMILGRAIEVLVENWAIARFVKVTGTIQREFIKKAADIDLLCYDQKQYFDDFVIAASQSDEMITKAVICTAQMLGLSIGILTLGTLIMTINPIIAIFPIAGFIINLVTRFRITKLEYDYDMEYKRLMRKADYSKRVFYQPEYAKEIKLSDIEIPLRKQFDEAIIEIETTARKMGVKVAILSLINWISVFTILSYLCVPLYLGYLSLVKRTIALGDVAAMNNAQQAVRNNLDGFNYSLVAFQEVGQFAQRFRRFLDYEIKIEKQCGIKAVPRGRQVLKIENMSFRYEGAKKDTLHRINMTINPGERIAIVGENGAGKTTFVKLLMRLYDATEGSITYGNQNIKDFSTEEYRSIIGAVFQDFQLYGATLAENVVMGEYSKEQEVIVRKALDLADFTRKLSKLSDGLNTEMTKEFSEKGTMLSGGETQKVAIARMFAKGNELSIAILDEPSSALDALAEAKLTKNMLENVKDASIIFISHRLSTTKDADHIYMFEEGRIIEEGTHEELMKLRGRYADMFEKQSHYYQDEIEKEVS